MQKKLKNPPLLEGQLTSSDSLPVHPTRWKRILPVPAPNKAGEPTADASEREEKCEHSRMMNATG